MPSPCGAGQARAPEPMGLAVPADPLLSLPSRRRGSEQNQGPTSDRTEHVPAEAFLPGLHRAAPLLPMDLDTSSPCLSFLFWCMGLILVSTNGCWEGYMSSCL